MLFRTVKSKLILTQFYNKLNEINIIVNYTSSITKVCTYVTQSYSIHII